MRILLIAQDFPPAGSPQALRWGYLSREFAAAGHDVQVLTAGLPLTSAGALELPAGIKIRHVSGGPITWVMHWLEVMQAARQRMRAAAQVPAPAEAGPAVMAAAGSGPATETVAVPLNWKGRLVVRVRDYLSDMLYPDLRGEWRYPAKRALQAMIAEARPDIVISSHEPATTLELGLHMQRSGFRWIADLGDPVLADYTPPRWRRRAFKLERCVYRNADAIVVTAPAAMELLSSRHGPRPVGRRPVEMITQGFDDLPGCENASVTDDIFDPQRLELLYTGSFYRFRRPDALLEAIGKVPDVRLNVASVAIPEWLRPALEANSEQIRVLGYLPHLHVRRLQRVADVLVNIANDDPCQMPGKVFEYLGAGRPILHMCKHENDLSASVVIDRRRGWVCGNDAASIAELLSRLQRRKPGRVEDPDFDLGGTVVREFGWSRLASRFLDLATALVERQAPRGDVSG